MVSTSQCRLITSDRLMLLPLLINLIFKDNKPKYGFSDMLCFVGDRLHPNYTHTSETQIIKLLWRCCTTDENITWIANITHFADMDRRFWFHPSTCVACLQKILSRAWILRCQGVLFEQMNERTTRGICVTHNLMLDSVSLHVEWNISQKPACDEIFYL